MTTARTAATRAWLDRVFGERANAESNTHMAVAGFIATSPGTIRLSGSTSKIHPARTRIATAEAKSAHALRTLRRTWGRLGEAECETDMLGFIN